MSKVATSTSARRPVRSGLACAALAALLLLPPPDAVAAGVEPVLRLSTQFDVARLGKVSEDERAVLRVEWRAALTGAEEARSVQQMLDSLRRMEGTVSDLSRLMRSMPAQKAVVAPTPIEPPEPEADGKSLALGAGAAAALLALFWLARRKSPKASAGAISPEPALDGSSPPPTAGAGALPDQVPPNKGAADTTTQAGQSVTTPAPPAPATEAKTDAGMPPGEIEATAAHRETAPAPEPVPMKPAKPPSGGDPPSASHSTEIPPIEFSLEEADAESVARANAMLLKMQATSPVGIPTRPPESHVEPTLELAEIMLSMGLEQSAAQALVEFSEANPRQALYHWLKLLDIYRGSGHRKDFKETAEKLRQHFNIQAEDWTRAGTGDVPTLENFSRVAGHVQEVWAQPEECIGYLRHLLEDNREGSRAGFPQPVAEEILLLIEILKATSGADQAAGM